MSGWRPAPAHRTEAEPSSLGRTYCQPQCAIRLVHMHTWSALRISPNIVYLTFFGTFFTIQPDIFPHVD